MSEIKNITKDKKDNIIICIGNKILKANLKNAKNKNWETFKEFIDEEPYFIVFFDEQISFILTQYERIYKEENYQETSIRNRIYRLNKTLTEIHKQNEYVGNHIKNILITQNNDVYINSTLSTVSCGICEFYKSTNKGVSWETVYSEVLRSYWYNLYELNNKIYGIGDIDDTPTDNQIITYENNKLNEIELSYRAFLIRSIVLTKNEYILYSVNDYDEGEDKNKIFLSKDYGQTWELNFIIENSEKDFILKSCDELLFLTNGELSFYSKNNELKWLKFNHNVNKINGILKVDDEFLIASEDGLFITKNINETWEKIL